MLLFKGKRVTISLNSLEKVPYRPPFPHDHSCDFLSVGLKGGYKEMLFFQPADDLSDKAEVKRGFGNLHFMKNKRAHYITEILGDSALTIFVTWNYLHKPSMIYSPYGYIPTGEFYKREMSGQSA
jgi:hypothetical protein